MERGNYAIIDISMSQASGSPLPSRITLVTGATGAIGKAIALAIAVRPGHEVVLVARNEAKARQTVDEIIRATGNPAVRYELADLSHRSSIQALAARWQGPLHVLVNNAAASPRKRLETPEGIEMQFATNVLGYFWMTLAFKKILKQSAPARIINVASYWAGDLDLDDLEFKHRSYHNGIAYRQYKQANIVLTTAFAWRLAPYSITINACHPGDVNSKLSNDLGFGGHETPVQGAETPVWLATAAEVENITGKYFENRSLVPNRFLGDRAAAEKLYQTCLSY
jgi:NAD(P)-dependent dehydrogenase (short-subunit alcohol dehydrogenase family)